jgi:hypothetical protein
MAGMDIIDRPELVEVAGATYGDVRAVFTQDDKWDTHIFVLYQDQGIWTVAMIDASKEEPGYQHDDDELEEAIDEEMPIEENQYDDSLEQAMNDIVQYGDLVTEDEELIEALGEAHEVERVARMSRYARKVWLRDRGTTLDVYLSSLTPPLRTPPLRRTFSSAQQHAC